MKTVSSLVASSTVGVAAAGLALGRPDRSIPVRPTSRKRKVGDFADANSRAYEFSSPLSRPGTSSTVITPENLHRQALDSSIEHTPPIIHQQQRPTSTRVENNNNGRARRWSIARNTELSSPREIHDDGRRDSVSSRSSWIRRLSTIPISQSNSPRSSVGPDSPSLTFSNGSAGPILQNFGSSPAQLPPNKLVKRVPSGRLSTSIVRSGSQSQVPTLRRPATSHQRSVTLQQQFRDHSIESNDRFTSTPSKSNTQSTPPSKSTSPAAGSWRPFFESRPTKLTKERLSGKSTDGSMQSFHSTSRRVMPDETVKACLVQPGMIGTSKVSYTAYYDEDSYAVEDLEEDEPVEEENIVTSTESPTEPHKRARRSLSMNFSSPSWGILRSGSLRGKRNADGRNGKRYSSAPVPTISGRKSTTSHGPPQSAHRAITDPIVFQQQSLLTDEASHDAPVPVLSFQQRRKDTSSPLPPLSRLSSFNLDLARLGLSSSASSAPGKSPISPALRIQTGSTSFSSPTNSNPTSPLYFGSHSTKLSRPSEGPDRTSTLVGSEIDIRGGIGDDDDMDYQSETVYDSLRSGTTGSIRSNNAHLDSMFDESPPSVASTKNKRLSIHELLNGMREGTERIVEEDEGMSTPVKDARSRSSQEANLRTPVRTRALDFEDHLKSSPPSFSLASKEFGRLSLDDDEDDDEDWTRDDDDNPEISSLSLPSSSLNSRRVSPNFRAALADLTHSSFANETPLPSIERPKSNLFDWSEPQSSDKQDKGSSSRPKTAHANQITDGRGGRVVGRRGPNALHVRSQSVPVVPDVNGQRENSKLAPKFGTWGLGAKGVSEEWDGDFEFDTPAHEIDEGGDLNMENSGMIVPEAIQATQKQIVGHVGQIREVCLLVDGLKRLRMQAREKNLLGGDSAHLWTEAEGIIALAVPDEEDEALSPHSPKSPGFGSELTYDRFAGYGADAEDVEVPDAPIEVLSRNGNQTGFVYDGHIVRRRSVLSSDDDIFGAGTIVHPPHRDHLRPPSTSPRHSHSQKPSSEYARSVMETMHQHRVVSDPSLPEITDRTTNKMPFDTTSLRDLVNRASALTRQLSDLIRQADGSQSPDVKRDRSHGDRDREASPAVLQLTRAFTPTTDSTSTGSPKHLPRSQSSNSVLNGTIDSSPKRNLGQRMHMMTVV